MARLRAVVVEDQPLARDHIVAMLSDHGVDVVATCANGLEAVERIPAAAPDVVFLDIELPELNGFEVIEVIGLDQMPRVVFITAFDAYTLKAFDVFAAGYLLKPVDESKLARLVERLKAQQPSATSGRVHDLVRLLGAPQVRPRPQRLAVRTGDRVVFVRLAEVEWIEASGNYAIIHARGERFQVRQPMQLLQRRLESSFARVHRSSLINLHHIVELRGASHGEYDVVMKSGRLVRVTRRFRGALEGRLKLMP